MTKTQELVFKISKALGLYPKEQQELEKCIYNKEHYGWLEALAKNENIDDDLFKEFEKECEELPLSKKAYLLFLQEDVEVRVYNYTKDETTGEILGYQVCFEWYSDAGEDMPDEIDLPINFTDQDLYEFYYNLYNNFDVDEHVEPLVEIRGTRGVPSSISDLVEDAKMIEQKYQDISEGLFNIVYK